MFSTTFAQFVVNTTKSSLSAAGISGIFEFANPKAAAVSTAASLVSGRVLRVLAQEMFGDKLPLVVQLPLVASLFVAKVYIGTKAGQQIDRNFDYLSMVYNTTMVEVGTAALTTILGINELG